MRGCAKTSEAGSALICLPVRRSGSAVATEGKTGISASLSGQTAKHINVGKLLVL